MCYYMETEDSMGELEIMLYNHIATMLIFQKMVTSIKHDLHEISLINLGAEASCGKPLGFRKLP